VAPSSAALPHLTGYLNGRVIGDGIRAEHVPVPAGELDEESIDQVVARSREGRALGRVRWVGETPHASSQVVPWRVYQASRSAVAEIDHDEPPGITFPAPGPKVLISIVSWPSRPITQLPTALPECLIGHGWQEAAIEGAEDR
jgi:hypothetical protein